MSSSRLSWPSRALTVRRTVVSARTGVDPCTDATAPASDGLGNRYTSQRSVGSAAGEAATASMARAMGMLSSTPPSMTRYEAG